MTTPYSLLTPAQASSQPFQFSIGDAIQVTADKGYRYGSVNRFEALGNVVITHIDEALYGETASLNMELGTIDVKGNVRYIGPMMTMYGSELDFNTKSQFLTVRNAKILANGYTVQGETMTRVAPQVVLAQEAEYSTCRDCPESWSVYGKKVRIVLGEYIYITHALIKVNGVTVMYVPYMVLPIKKGRQTGLLFPQFSLSFRDGFQYKQPWFWAINRQSDLTLAPMSSGRRGMGNQFEYRHILGEGKWFEFRSMQANDRMYVPNKRDNRSLTGTHYFRHFSDYEHHYQGKNFFNHHLYYQNSRDLDFIDDYRNFTNPYINGTELGAGTFFDVKSSLTHASLEGYFNRNLMVPDAREFDHSYVQIMPRLSFNTIPVNVIRFPYLFKNVSVGSNADYTFFKQNHVKKYLKDPNNPNSNFILNAHRLTLNPYIDIYLASVGPFDLKTQVQMDYQQYHFPFEEEKKDKTFRKRGTILTSEFNFEIDKIFGLAYIERVPLNQLNLTEEEKKEFLEKKQLNNKKKKSLLGLNNSPEESSQLLGQLPPLDKSYVEDYIEIPHSSYRHSLFFNFKHHYTSDQKFSGSPKFTQQITEGQGLFDYQDAPRQLRHEIGSLATRTDISQRNTLEFQLFNSLFKKDAKSYDQFNLDEQSLRDQFTYSKLAYFNLSQGLEMDTGEEHFKDKLTRLHINTGFPVGKWSLSFSDYYFYQTRKHKFVSSIARSGDYYDFSLSWRYDSLSEPSAKFLDFQTTIRPYSTFSFVFTHSRDLTKQQSLTSQYDMWYSPWNNCWKLNLGYAVNPRDRQIMFNFLVNFGEERFTSLLRPAGGAGG